MPVRGKERLVDRSGPDSANRRTIMADRTGSTVWGYDVANRLTSLTTPQGATTYTYNNADQRLTMVEAGVGTTTYDYDNDGRPEWVQNPFAETTSWLYDTAGRTSQQTLSSGVYEEYGYDGHSRLNAITVKNSGGTVIESQALTYDDNSNLAVRTHNGVATNYTYDAINQLLSEARTGYSGSYTYDANGNRLTKTINGVGTTYGYDDADKLTGYVTNGQNTSYTYDAAGRPVYFSGSTPKMLYWSYECELSNVYFNPGKPPTPNNSFSYNGLSTWVSARNRQNVTTTFMRDGAGVTDDVISDTSASCTPGISERRGGVTTFQHSGIKNNDAQSVVAQTVSATREYDAFGNVASSAGTFAGPFGYGGSFGYQSDSETGYKLLGHRYYDSETGRFLTRDKAKDGRNWYAYCDNNPLTSADPSGRSALTRLLRKVIKIGLKNGTEVKYLVMKNMGDAKRAAHQLDPSGEVVHHPGHGNPRGPGHFQNKNRPEIHVTWEEVADKAGVKGSVWENWRNMIASCVAFLDPTGISDAMEAGELAGEVIDPYAKKWRAGLEHYRIGRWLGDD